ncbi:MAG: LysM peptidoglycan-binding domain-containing protein [Caldilineae bacterium]|nr:MAG: LysM peptidoglycan-binding domain-containing protein [Caldilineae bacterium]
MKRAIHIVRRALLAGVLLLILWGEAAGSRAALAAGMTTGGSDIPVQAVAQGKKYRIYVVKRGDTLSKIARRFGVSVKTLVRINRLKNPNLIFVGQRLRIPAGAQPVARPTPAPTPTVSPTLPWTPPDQAIELFSPVADALYHSPIEVIGYSRTSEGVIQARLLDEEGLVLAERTARGGSERFDFFHTYLRFVIDREQPAMLEVFERSPADGSVDELVRVPLTLVPGQRFVDVNLPRVGADVCETITVEGYSETFEGVVVVVLQDRKGEAMELAIAMGGAGGFYEPFQATLAFAAEEPRALLVGAYEESPRDGRSIDFTRVPIGYRPDRRACR